MLKKLAKKYKYFFVFSDSAKKGGVASAIGEFLYENRINNINLTSFEYEDNFIPHGSINEIEEYLNISPKQLKNKVMKILKSFEENS